LRQLQGRLQDQRGRRVGSTRAMVGSATSPARSLSCGCRSPPLAGACRQEHSVSRRMAGHRSRQALPQLVDRRGVDSSQDPQKWGSPERPATPLIRIAASNFVRGRDVGAGVVGRQLAWRGPLTFAIGAWRPSRRCQCRTMAPREALFGSARPALPRAIGCRQERIQRRLRHPWRALWRQIEKEAALLVEVNGRDRSPAMVNRKAEFHHSSLPCILHAQIPVRGPARADRLLRCLG